MFDALAPFTVGLLGSMHCIGMCGPLVLAYSLHFKTAARLGGAGAPAILGGALAHHLAFHMGRIISYGVLGAAAAALFQSVEVQRFSMQYRGGAMIFAGVVLLLIGLVLLGILQAPPVLVRISTAAFPGKWISAMLNSRSLASRVGIGLAAGFLPCGLTWAMLVTAASTLHPGKGFLTMVSFGLGTIPLLFMTGISASFLSARTRLLGERAAAVAVIAMGLLILAKGGSMLYATGGCH